jgi:hypothetical protein
MRAGDAESKARKAEASDGNDDLPFDGRTIKGGEGIQLAAAAHTAPTAKRETVSMAVAGSTRKSDRSSSP